jgi:hypothetical protein
MSRRENDPYITGRWASASKIKKRDITGEMVGLAHGLLDDRGLILILQRQRVLQKNEIHELLTTDEADAEPGKTVNRISIIGFLEITQGGVIGVGDRVFINDREIGRVVGYDETHFPNHYNLVLLSPQRPTGIGLGIGIGDSVRFSNLEEDIDN